MHVDIDRVVFFLAKDAACCGCSVAEKRGVDWVLCALCVVGRSGNPAHH